MSIILLDHTQQSSCYSHQMQTEILLQLLEICVLFEVKAVSLILKINLITVIFWLLKLREIYQISIDLVYFLCRCCQNWQVRLAAKYIQKRVLFLLALFALSYVTYIHDYIFAFISLPFCARILCLLWPAPYFFYLRSWVLICSYKSTHTIQIATDLDCHLRCLLFHTTTEVRYLHLLMFAFTYFVQRVCLLQVNTHKHLLSHATTERVCPLQIYGIILILQMRESVVIPQTESEQTFQCFDQRSLLEGQYDKLDQR